IWLVAEREIATRAKTRSFLISTGLLMVVIIVGAVVWSALSGGDDADRVGVVGQNAALTQTIEEFGSATGTSV
ncbi:ABC transporter permease, partial [Streptomyces sp. SID10244]|nr:ABC transporter permease [Streptomyces sp. SID10244]